MSEPIKAGDLVVVIKPKGCCSESLGLIFFVKEIVPSSHWAGHTTWRCRSCGATGPFKHNVQAEFAACENGTYVLTKRLKRIDPPSDEMKRETSKELEQV